MLLSKMAVIVLFIQIFISASANASNSISCSQVLRGTLKNSSLGPSQPFTFPHKIEEHFQTQLKEKGLNDLTIDAFQRSGLGHFSDYSHLPHNLFTDVDFNPLTRLDILKIYQAALAAINKTHPNKNLKSLWQVVYAIDTHERIHHTLHHFKIPVRVFIEQLGEYKNSRFQDLANTLNEAYPNLHRTFNSGRYHEQTEQYYDFHMEELYVILVWEETLFQNADRVLNDLNDRLRKKNLTLLNTKDVLTFIREEATYYSYDRDLTQNPSLALQKEYPSFFSNKIDDPTLNDVQRILNPNKVKRSRLEANEIQSLELESIFSHFGYHRNYPQEIKQSRFLEPVLEDLGEIQSRTDAQKDLIKKGRPNQKLLADTLQTWLEYNTGRLPYFSKNLARKILESEGPIDLNYFRRQLRLNENDPLTRDDLLDIMESDVVTTMNDMIRLFRYLAPEEERIDSQRIRAWRWMAQSVIDPHHDFSLNDYYIQLTQGSKEIRRDALKKLYLTDDSKLQNLMSIYTDVQFILDLHELGETIQGTHFATVLTPSPSDEAFIRIELGHNALLKYNKNLNFESVPNSLILGSTQNNSSSQAENPTPQNAAVIYGENENGKTTFLRTVGQLVHLAMIGCRLPVEAMELTPFEVATALNSADSLKQNLSHHAADIEAINRVVHKVQQDPKKTLALIDELGTGTNTEAGQAIESSYLDWLIQSGAITLLSTHRLSTYQQTKYPERIQVLTASQYKIELKPPVLKNLIDGSIKSLEKHNSPTEIIEDVIRRLNQH